MNVTYVVVYNDWAILFQARWRQLLCLVMESNTGGISFSPPEHVSLELFLENVKNVVVEAAAS